MDTGLRLDGLPALELWDLIVSVFGNIAHISDRTGKLVNGKNKSHNKIDVMQDIDSVPSNVQSASQEALLYVFEDNEAVIKMIMKGRSPTMRHVPELTELLLIGCSIELICKGNEPCTSYSRTFYDTQMATANCVHPHAQFEHA